MKDCRGAPACYCLLMLKYPAFIALAFLVGCAPSSEPTWLNPGTPALQAEQDFLGCAAQARRDFPELFRITTAPRVTIGGGFCRSNVCVGANNAPVIFDSDRNEPLRSRSVAACMQAKGYRQADLPQCTGGTVTPLQSHPFDTRGVCVTNGRLAAP